uniref:Uncharacterized protein n=1 Tax=Opuntia streptacantha TaxID=393608 RepID=A0A7C8ZD43_OPUST
MLSTFGTLFTNISACPDDPETTASADCPAFMVSLDISTFCLFIACPACTSLLTPVACFASLSNCRRNSFRFCSSISCFLRSSSFNSSKFSIFFCTGGTLGPFVLIGLESLPTLTRLSAGLGMMPFNIGY